MTPEAIKKVCKAVALVCMAAGACGGLLCVPYLIWYNAVPILVAASLPMIAGSILVGGGLISYSLLLKD